MNIGSRACLGQGKSGVWYHMGLREVQCIFSLSMRLASKQLNWGWWIWSYNRNLSVLRMLWVVSLISFRLLSVLALVKLTSAWIFFGMALNITFKTVVDGSRVGSYHQNAFLMIASPSRKQLEEMDCWDRLEMVEAFEWERMRREKTINSSSDCNFRPVFTKKEKRGKERKGKARPHSSCEPSQLLIKRILSNPLFLPLWNRCRGSSTSLPESGKENSTKSKSNISRSNHARFHSMSQITKAM
jgi:hypothetical protein